MAPAAGVLEGRRCPKLALSKMLGFRRYVGPLPAASPAVCSQGWLPGDTAVAAKADLQRFVFTSCSLCNKWPRHLPALRQIM